VVALLRPLFPKLKEPKRNEIQENYLSVVFFLEQRNFEFLFSKKIELVEKTIHCIEHLRPKHNCPKW
jgi:hypothetical protein